MSEIEIACANFTRALNKYDRIMDSRSQMEKFIELLEQLCDTLRSMNDGVATMNESLFQLTSVYEGLRKDVDMLIENNQKGAVK